MRFVKALAALAALGGLTFGVPWALFTLIGNPVPAEGLAWNGALSDRAIVGLLAVVCWLLWAQLMVCVVAEVRAAWRGREALPPLGTFAAQQEVARKLVLAVLAVASFAPLTTQSFPQAAPAPAEPSSPAANSTSASTDNRRTPSGPGASSRDASGRSEGGQRATARAGALTLAEIDTQTSNDATREVTVMRLDSLWAIAERELGDGERWHEIAALNQGAVMNDGRVFAAAAHIEPGWVLRVPNTPRPAGQRGPIRELVEVVPGDTLSEIAAAELGDADRYPELFAATKARVQPDGRQLVDPDLILPGWQIAVPVQPSDRANGSGGSPANPPPVNPPGPAGDQTDKPATAVSPPDDREEVPGEFSALRALLGASGIFAAGLAGLLVVNRRRQLRARRPGRMIAPVPEPVAPAEQPLLAYGDEPSPHRIDTALRAVAAHARKTSQPVPDVGAARLSPDGRLVLCFHCPCSSPPPPGWTAADNGLSWGVDLSTFDSVSFAADAEQVPYPTLVSVGTDRSGQVWLLELESLGTLRLAGHLNTARALRRFLVGELAVNPWAEAVEILVADSSETGVAGLNPERVSIVSDAEAAQRAAAEGRAGSVAAGEVVVLVATDGAQAVRREARVVLIGEVDSSQPEADQDPPATASVTASTTAPATASATASATAPATLVCSETGSVTLPAWGAEVEAFQLSQSDAEAMAVLLAATRSDHDAPVPADPSDPRAALDGALRQTEGRESAERNPSSLLPLPDAYYLARSATTTQDLAELAPKVETGLAADLLARDPDLDADVSDWFAAGGSRPRVQILGPVDVTIANPGELPPIAHTGAAMEFIIYLACQERGVTKDRAAEDLGWSGSTVQNRARDARRLLGYTSDGRPWLPDASKTESALRRGVPTYELAEGVLLDADLFRRLRRRAQARGESGLEDLHRALTLVAGAPFDQLRRGGYRWLYEGQRYDHILAGAIEDVAHVLVTHCLAEGDPEGALQAAQIAARANPYSDTPLLDLAAITEASQGRQRAESLLREKLTATGEDLPPRTSEILDQRDWLR